MLMIHLSNTTHNSTLNTTHGHPLAIPPKTPPSYLSQHYNTPRSSLFTTLPPFLLRTSPTLTLSNQSHILIIKYSINYTNYMNYMNYELLITTHRYSGSDQGLSYKGSDGGYSYGSVEMAVPPHLLLHSTTQPQPSSHHTQDILL